MAKQGADNQYVVCVSDLSTAEAIPNCNISFSKGEAMHKAVEGMLTVLFEANPKSIGGKLPDKDFYYGI